LPLTFFVKNEIIIAVKSTERKKIIERLLIIPKTNKRAFWAKETKFLMELIEKFPDLNFWNKINLPKKYDSLLSLRGDWGKTFLKKKYLEFNYIIPNKEKIQLGDKFGKDRVIIKKPKTIRDFLKNE